MTRIFGTALISFLLMSCSALPEALRLSKTVELLPYDEVGDMDLAPTNHQALWGGVIANTVNYSDRTRLEVIFFPLNEKGKPLTDKESLGRFRVYAGDFKDPYVYRPGRLVTVLGTLGIRETGYVGQYPYDYTVLHSLEMHLWLKEKPMPVPVSIERYLPLPSEFSSF